MKARKLSWMWVLPVLLGAGGGWAQSLPVPAELNQYVRMHATAVAFTETYDQLSKRYRTLRPTELERARVMIGQAELAAGSGSYQRAEELARGAYEVLRGAITQAVAAGAASG